MKPVFDKLDLIKVFKLSIIFIETNGDIIIIILSFPLSNTKLSILPW